MRRFTGIIALILILPFLAQSVSAQITITDLGTGSAKAINDNGQVVGNSNHAFSWTASGGMVDLGTLPGMTDSSAKAINDNGQVVGYSYTGSGGHAFSWIAGAGMVDLGTLPGGTDSYAVAINDNGQVVGNSYTGSELHAFSWTAGAGMVDLGTLTGMTNSNANAINDNGQVVGYSYTGSGYNHAILWNFVSNLFDFSLAASPQSQIVRPGGNAIFTVESTLLSGIRQNVDLGVTVMNAATGTSEPSIVSSISPSSVLPTSSATVFVGTNSNTPAGIYNVIVTGTSGIVHKSVSISVTVSGKSLPDNPIALSSFTLKLVTGTPLADQIKVPSTGNFVVVLSRGNTFSVIDNDATDGVAKIQVMDNKIYKLYGRVTGGGKNAYAKVLSPFISEVIMPQSLTLPKTSPPATIDITSVNPYILQIPAQASNVDSTKLWVSSYYPSIGLPYSFSNSGAQETQLIFILQ
jgi:probable HAF family extracellular repeat protein